MLKAALERLGYSVYMPLDQNKSPMLGSALAHCKLVIILGTVSYGRQGESTQEVLCSVVDRRIPRFVVKMCSEFGEPEVRSRLPDAVVNYHWTNLPHQQRHQVPADLLHQIEQHHRSLITVGGKVYHS